MGKNEKKSSSVGRQIVNSKKKIEPETVPRSGSYVVDKKDFNP